MSAITVHDVAAAVLAELGTGVSTMKLQKLTYLSQGWSLGLRGEPLFDEEFQAWQRGPVSRDLFRHHRQEFSVSSWPYEGADHGKLGPIDQAIVSAVIRNYGALTGLELSELTHQPGTPWSVVRKQEGLTDGQRSEAAIPKDLIKSYFAKQLLPGREPQSV